MRTKITLLLSFVFSLSFSQKPTDLPSDTAVIEFNKIFTTIKSVHANPYFRFDSIHLVNKRDSIEQVWLGRNAISAKEFVRTSMKFVALMSNGHTSVDWLSGSIIEEIKSHAFLPLQLSVKENGDVFIAKSMSKNSDLQGKQLKAINNQPIEDLVSAWSNYVGGVTNFKNNQIGLYASIYNFLEETTEEPYQLTLASGEKFEVKGVGVGKLNSLVQPNEKKKEAYTFEIIEENIGLLSYNLCEDLEAFKEFLATTFEEIKSENIEKLIIDVRQNPGGDSRLNDELLSYITTTPYRQMTGRYWKVSHEVKTRIKDHGFWEEFLPDSFLQAYLNHPTGQFIEEFDTSKTVPTKPMNFFTGKVCVLQGSSTFSSANMLVDAIKTFRLATLIGAPSGELTNDYGEVVTFYLKRAQVHFMVPSTYDIGANGEADVQLVVLPDVYAENALKAGVKWLN